MDYETNFIGGVGSQYCFNYKDFEGLMILTSRKVVSRKPSWKVLLETGRTESGCSILCEGDKEG